MLAQETDRSNNSHGRSPPIVIRTIGNRAYSGLTKEDKPTSANKVGTKTTSKHPSPPKRRKTVASKQTTKTQRHQIETKVDEKKQKFPMGQRIYAPPKRIASVDSKPQPPIEQHIPLLRANSTVGTTSKPKETVVRNRLIPGYSKYIDNPTKAYENNTSRNVEIPQKNEHNNMETTKDQQSPINPLVYFKTGEPPKEQFVNSHLQIQRSASKIAKTCKKCCVCGKSVSVNINGVCKLCINQFQKSNVKVGTIEEFKVYANKVAHSVKKIVAIGDQTVNGTSEQRKENNMLTVLENALPRMIEESNKTALVPVNCCTDNSISFGSDFTYDHFSDDNSDHNDLGTIIDPCLDGVCPLPARKREKKSELGKVSDSVKSPRIVDFDMGHVMAIEYPETRGDESSDDTDNSKALVPRSNADIVIRRYRPESIPMNTYPKLKIVRDRSSSVDPPNRERSTQLSKDNSRLEIESLNRNRSITYTETNKNGALTKADRANKISSRGNTKDKAMVKLKSGTNQTRDHRQKESEENDEEDEDEDNVQDDGLYFCPDSKSLMEQLKHNRINLSTDAVLTLEQQRQWQIRRLEKQQSLTNERKYCNTNLGKVIASNNEKPNEKYPSNNAIADDGQISLSSAIKSKSFKSLTAKDGVYYGSTEGKSVLTKSSSGSQIDDNSCYTYHGPYNIDNSFKETDIDNGKYVYVSTDNKVKKGSIEKKVNDSFYMSADLKRSQSDLGNGSVLKRDHALGSGENSSLRKSPYWEGLLGYVGKLAKKCTFGRNAKSSESTQENGSVRNDVYTGGLFKKVDMFYDNDESTSSSVSSKVYFDSESVSLSTDSNRSGFYTGEVFANPKNDSTASSLQLSLSDQIIKPDSSEALKDVQDGSANNSTGPNRRQRTRPPIDCLSEQSSDSEGGIFSRVLFSPLSFYNVSNNSSTGFYDREDDAFFVDSIDDVEISNPEPQETTMTPTREYTEFCPGTEPRVEAPPELIATRPFDFSRYESVDAPLQKFFFGTVQETSSLTYLGGVGPSNMNNETLIDPSVGDDVAMIDSSPYSSTEITKFEDNNNSHECEVCLDTNNNYPDYDEMYAKKNNEQEEQRKREEQERLLRRQQESSYSTGFFNDNRQEETPPIRMPSPRSMSGYGGSPYSYQDPAPGPAGYYQEIPTPNSLPEVVSFAQQPRAPVRPLLMKLGAITVRNNVESDDHYAANINMDLKGGPGAHPIPIDGTGERRGQRDWAYEDDSYSSNYNPEMCIWPAWSTPNERYARW